MSKISDLIEKAGARAEAVPAFARELLLSLEARVEALEGLNAPRAAAPKPAAEPEAEKRPTPTEP